MNYLRVECSLISRREKVGRLNIVIDLLLKLWARVCTLRFLNYSSLVVKTLLLIWSLWMILPLKIIIITIWLWKLLHRVCLWLGLKYLDFGSESKSIMKLCLNKEQLWSCRIILSSVHTQRNSRMCFLPCNHGIVGKENWTYLGLFQSFLFCRCSITEKHT